MFARSGQEDKAVTPNWTLALIFQPTENEQHDVLALRPPPSNGDILASDRMTNRRG
jgi:hypothetical protein